MSAPDFRGIHISEDVRPPLHLVPDPADVPTSEHVHTWRSVNSQQFDQAEQWRIVMRRLMFEALLPVLIATVIVGAFLWWVTR